MFLFPLVHINLLIIQLQVPVFDFYLLCLLKSKGPKKVRIPKGVNRAEAIYKGASRRLFSLIMQKAEKTFFIDNLTSELKAISSAILVDYTGLSVADQRELKKRLKEANSRFVVIKNTLFKLAGKNAKVSENLLTDTILSGQNALILADKDPIAPLPVVSKFASEFEKLKIKAGVIEGSFADKESLENLSKLGSKNAVVGQVVGILSDPTYQTVMTLEAKLRELVSVIEQIGKKPNN